jgi:hypothetical protein
MSFDYGGAFGEPGIRASVETKEQQVWFSRPEQQVWIGAVISGAARDNGNSGYETVLRPGLILGMISSTKKLVQWSPTATDGSQRVYGILGHSQKMQRLGSNADRHFSVLVAGFLQASRLLVPGNASYGISGDTNEYLLRAQVYPRFMLDDMPMGNAFGNWASVDAKTADHTITEAENNTLFTNRGAGGAVILTLPATPKKGLRYGAYVAADQSLTFTAASAGQMIAFNDAAANSVGYATGGDKLGGFIEVIGDGTSWLVLPVNFADGVNVQTLTIAT